MKHPSHVISTIKHPTVAAARRSLGQMGGQPATAFLAEGPEMVLQALAARAPIEAVFCLHPVQEAEEAVSRSARQAGVECHSVTRAVFSRILGLGYETAARVLATVSAKPLQSAEAMALVDNDACILVGEKIQDPRNVGVLIRTADAMALTMAAFSKGSADPYSRASVRSTTGSIFRVPLVVDADIARFITALKGKSVRIIGTSAHATTPCSEADLSRPCAILLGNETAGLSAEAKEACDVVVSIPMYGGAHSFNVTVAAGIVLYEVARQNARRSG
jgi:TrmH family RNA methyltransferase